LRAIVLVLIFVVWPYTCAQATADAEFFASGTLQPITHPFPHDQKTPPGLKQLGNDFDSAIALQTSQAAIGQQLADYVFHDRNANAVTLSNFRGKPVVISLIYTSCFHICPTTTRNLARAIKAARSAVGVDTFSTISIGFDVLHDTPERMRSFARQQGLSGENNWAFLSTDKDTIIRLASDTGFIFTPSSKGFDHLIQTTVVDKEGKIYRQIYGINFDPSILTEALKELVFGLDPATFSLSSLTDRIRLFCTVYDPASGTYTLNYAMIFGMTVGIFMLLVTGIFFYRFLRD